MKKCPKCKCTSLIVIQEPDGKYENCLICGRYLPIIKGVLPHIVRYHRRRKVLSNAQSNTLLIESLERL